MKKTLYEWQKTLKPISDLIVQASSKDRDDSWQEWPIGMSWQYALNYEKGDSLQIGNHNILVLSAMRKETDQKRRPYGVNRFSISENLSKNGIITSHIDHETYFSILPFCKFVVSPEGNGIDCHRHYEALMAGCIPIIEKNPLTEKKYKDYPVLWTTDYSEITPEYLKEKYEEMINKEYDFSYLFLSNYTSEQQKQIKECGNLWIQENLKKDWYTKNMNIVYAFVGKLPPYCIDTVYQTRLFYKGPIYFIINDLESQHIPKLKEYNVIIVDYNSVVHNEFNKLVERKYNKFEIVEKLVGREKLFIHAFERFYLLHNLMIQQGLKDVFFMELDNLIYDDPTLWLESFSKKEMAFMIDNVMSCSSGIAYIKNTNILQSFMYLCNEYIEYSNDFQSEMKTLFLFWNNNKESVQLLPTHWEDSKYPGEVYKNFPLYKDSIFDALSIGIYIAGIDPHHSNGVLTKGLKSQWGLIDYTVYSYKWELDDKGRNIPYVYNGAKWIRINNLHVHSKDLKPVLSVPM
jgi:6-pyruvoyl-tetrahydropterin synthase